MRKSYAVEDDNATNDTFRNSGSFATLDLKLAGLFSKNGWMPKPLARKIERLQEDEMIRFRNVLNGRQILFQICNHLRTSSSLKTYFNIEQLMDIQWHGDSPEQIGKFLSDWIRVTNGMRTALEDVEFAELLYTRMKDSTVMKSVCELYRRASHHTPGKGDNTYTFLLESLQHYLDDVLEDKNLESTRAEHRRQVGLGNRDQKRTDKPTHPSGPKESHGYGAPAEDKGKGKGGGKGKGEGKKDKDKGKGKDGGRDRGSGGKGQGKDNNGGQDQGAGRSQGADKGKGKGKENNTGKGKGSSGSSALEDFKPHPNPTQMKNLCKFHFTYQGCPREDCTRDHPVVEGKPQRLCLQFNSKNGCTKQNCKMLHELVGQKVALWVSNEWEKHGLRRSQPCVAFANGNCKFGAKCSYKHK